MLRAFALVVTVVSFPHLAMAQRVGSADAARYLAAQENEAAMNEAQWNVAKKLGKNFEPVAKYKQTQQDFSPFEIGENAVGFIQKWPLKVVSIVDASNAIVSLGEHIFWMEDFPTDDLADGESVRVLDPIRFTKAKSYGAVSGSKKTVKAFRMLTKEEFEKHKQEEQEINKEKERATRKSKSFAFEFADGKSADYVFVDIKKGKVILEDLDGKTTEHLLGDFTQKSSALLRELFKKKAKPDPKKK